MLALEFREPSVAALQRRISWRQYRRWREFDRIHPIDSRERVDSIVARAAVLIASAMGAKDLKAEDLDVASFRPPGRDEYCPPQSIPLSERRRKPSRRRVEGLDPALFEAFGASDGRKSR